MLGDGFSHPVEIVVTSAICVEQHDRWTGTGGVDGNVTDPDFVELHGIRVHDHMVMYQSSQPGKGTCLVSQSRSGVLPFGHKALLRVFIDPGQLQHDEVSAVPGIWHDLFGIEPLNPAEVSDGLVGDAKPG
jgi:hypothetical protein